MLSVRLTAPGELSLAMLPPPAAPGPGEAQVRVLRVGVCGTDLHAFAGSQPMIAYPVVLGHELAVEVVALGPPEGGAPLDPVAPGDLCAVIPYVNCDSCTACDRGRPNACTRLQVLGVHVDGGLAELINVPARLLVRTPGLRADVVALVEMLAIGEHAAARVELAPGESALVIGAGPIGLGVAAAAKRRGAEVALHDLDASRLAYGADAGLGKAVRADGSADLRQALLAALGRLPDVVFDATGSAASMSGAPALVAPGGRLALVGHTGGALTFDNQVLHRAELTVLACRNATRTDFEAVIAGLRDCEPDVERWITHRAKLEEVVDALPDWVARPRGLVKAVVEVA